MYLLKNSILMSDLFTVVVYIAARDKIHYKRLWKIVGLNLKDESIIKKEKGIMNLSENGRNTIIGFVQSRMPDISMGDIAAMTLREHKECTKEKIEKLMREATVSKEEIGALFSFNANKFDQYDAEEKIHIQSTLIANVLIAIKKIKSNFKPSVSLMCQRVVCAIDINEAADMLQIPVNTLWKYEWFNYMPVHLVEAASRLYRIDEEKVPLMPTYSHEFGKTIALLRTGNRITLADMEKATGISKTRCSYYETHPECVPPREYVVTLARMIGEDDDMAEKILVYGKKRDAAQEIHVPAETLDYYRHLYYKPEAHNGRSMQDLLSEAHVSRSSYENEKMRVSQLRRIARMLGIGADYLALTKKLTEEQKKILDGKIDYKLLKKARLEKGISIHMTALEIDRSEEIIQQIERGTYNCKPEVLMKLARVYEKPMNYFLI